MKFVLLFFLIVAVSMSMVESQLNQPFNGTYALFGLNRIFGNNTIARSNVSVKYRNNIYGPRGARPTTLRPTQRPETTTTLKPLESRFNENNKVSESKVHFR
jgi:hypothetical protein